MEIAKKWYNNNITPIIKGSLYGLPFIIQKSEKGANMKKDFLESLGLEAAAIETIMAEHEKTVQAEQARTTAKEAELKTAKETISGLQDTIRKFDGVDVEKLQQEAKDWERKYNEDLKAEKAKAENVRKEYALKEAMARTGVLDPDYLIYKAGGLEKFTFDKDDRPVGVEDALKPYKEDKAMAHLFKKETPPYDPKGGGTGAIANPFAKETFNMTKQGELFKQNPEQARAMAAAAGVKL